MPSPSGLVDKNQANKSEGRHIHNYSTFDRSLSYRLYNTHRFGDYTPTFVMEGVPNDEISLNSHDGIDSLSLKAPFKGSIRKIKESFMVPNMAILPLQWDRIYAQNSNGDDVPSDANCILSDFPATFKQLWLDCFAPVATQVSDLSTNAKACTFIQGFLRIGVLGEMIYSNGALLNVLGYKASTQFRVNQQDSQANALYTISYDEWFDSALYKIFEDISEIVVYEPVGSSNVTHRFQGLSGTYFEGYESFRSMIELFRENPLCRVYSISFASTATLSSWATSMSAELGSYKLFNTSSFQWYLPINADVDPSGSNSDITALNPSTLNLSRLLAYQLICAHFYSNSSIDFIYSADLYRQYIYNLYNVAYNNTPLTVNMTYFTWNGQKLPYDYLSGRLLKTFLGLSSTSLRTNFISNFTSNSSVYLSVLAIWSAVFGFRKSLRYGDYFTASRPRPLAPINTDVSVNNSLVSVIDITRNIQAQRFANAVMRSRSKIEEYVKSLFGRAPQPDYHNPFFLSRTEEIIFGDQVQNTAQNTNVSLPQSRTANFAGNLSRHTFTFHNDDAHPCIYMQIVSYDSPRAYCRSVDRQFLHIDRFDMFNPDFQYIGDQAVYGIELGYHSPSAIPDIFGYQTRDMEYKQRFDVCSSGFASGSLPGWAFTDDRLVNYNFTSISPNFIRSRNTDIDYLYLSLTGFSLGTYFHFTCVTDNNVSAKRAMAVDPQILA